MGADPRTSGSSAPMSRFAPKVAGSAPMARHDRRRERRRRRPRSTTARAVPGRCASGTTAPARTAGPTWPPASPARAREVEVAEYEPKMNVTPNAVALRRRVDAPRPRAGPRAGRPGRRRHAAPLPGPGPAGRPQGRRHRGHRGRPGAEAAMRRALAGGPAGPRRAGRGGGPRSGRPTPAAAGSIDPIDGTSNYVRHVPIWATPHRPDGRRRRGGRRGLGPGAGPALVGGPGRGRLRRR